MALFDILSPILAKLKELLGPFGKLWDFFTHFWSTLKGSFSKGLQLSKDITAEISAWKSFAVSIPFKTGVINIPKAVEQTKDLIDEIVNAWRAIVDLAKQIKSQLEPATGEDPAAEAKEALNEIEQGGLKDILTRFPKLLKGAEKVLGFAAIAIQVLESLEAAIDDLTAIVAAIRDLREEAEHGSTIFLQQKNSRKRVHLEDGTPMSLRIGSLHNSDS